MAGRFRVRLAGLGAVALALIILGAGRPAPAREARAASARATATPPGAPSFFASVSSGAGYEFNLELRSMASGRVTKVLTTLGGSWTNNGFALSPDGRDVYFTLIPKSRGWKSLLLERISTSTRRRRLVGQGEQPAVSPTGRLLAYATGEDRSAGIVIRDLASGAERSIRLWRLLGSKTDMLKASLAWLGDGRRLAVFEACCATAATSTGRTTFVASGPGGQSASYASRLIVVSVPRHGGLTARLVTGPGAHQTPESVGSDTARPNAVLASSFLRSDRAAVYRITLGSSRATVRPVLTIAHAQVLGFDPTGREILYLVGHRPPNLWTATVEGHRLIHRHLLIRNSKLDAIAW